MTKVLYKDLGTDNEPLPIHCGPNRAPICFVCQLRSRQNRRRLLAVVSAGGVNVGIDEWPKS